MPPAIRRRTATVQVLVDEHGVRVRDHGTGIEEADLPYVFDRFYRGANSRGRQGSGLGLAIVKQVAEQHGGTVRAENAAGGGALFTLALPTASIETDSPQAGGNARIRAWRAAVNRRRNPRKASAKTGTTTISSTGPALGATSSASTVSTATAAIPANKVACER